MSRHASVNELRELAAFFLRLGLTAFGGPAAHIALMEREVVNKREWLTHAEFLDLLGATNLIPGPGSTQMAMSIGYQRAGLLGLVLGGVCFIFPAALLTLGLAWAYVRYGFLPQAQSILYGIQPVIPAVVFQALWNLSKTACRSQLLVILGIVALAFSFLGLHPLIILLGAGLISAALIAIKSNSASNNAALNASWLPVSLGAATLPTVGLTTLFLFFLKLGAVLFGSGYVLLAFLKTDLVDHWHWLTEAQLLDAVAAGQLTPGPVFTTATFIGYILGGYRGATVATVGIFLPSFLFVAVLGLFLPRLRKSVQTAAFLDGINIGALALMISVTWALSRAACVDFVTITLGILSVIVLIRFKLNPIWLMSGGALVGLLLHHGLG